MRFEFAKPIAAIALWFFFSTAAPNLAASSFFTDFNAPLDPWLSQPNAPGYTNTISGGWLTLQKIAGTTNEWVSIGTRFKMTGNFTASTRVRQGAGNALCGFMVENDRSPKYYRLMFFWGGTNSVNAHEPNSTLVQSGCTSADVIFRIRRTNNCVLSEHSSDGGQTFQLLKESTAPGTSDPMAVYFFIQQKTFDPGPASISFDNLSIQSDGVIWNPGYGGGYAIMGLQKAVRPTLSNLVEGKKYQLQICNELKLWVNHGDPFVATASDMVYPEYFLVENWRQMFFRAEEVP